MVKKIFLTLAGLLGVAIVALVGVVAMQPGEFTVERSATIAAPPAAVFPHVNDLHAWQEWSPWAKRDPNVKNAFEGPPAGKGAVFHWDGNADVGAGSMTIDESKPDEHIRIKLEFIRPMQDVADVEFAFQPKEGQTVVTWKMHGKNNFIEKAFFLFMDLDQMVGGDFEKGLGSMKEVVEKKASAPPASEPAAAPKE